jgi:cytidylate kinase
MAVISISRLVGSGAHEISQLLSKQLGYQLFDQELMAKLGVEAGLISKGQVVDLTAERHHTHSPLERMSHLAPMRDILALGAYEASGVGAEDRSAELVSKIMLYAYEQGNVVVDGRGSQGVLRDKPGVLHVRLVAPLEQRIEYLKKRDNIGTDEARKKVKEADAAQVEYIRHYFMADINDPTLYHLIINTGKVTQAVAVDLITKALAGLPAKG